MAFNTKTSERISERFKALRITFYECFISFGVSARLCIASLWGKNVYRGVWDVCKGCVLPDICVGGFFSQPTATGNSCDTVIFFL